MAQPFKGCAWENLGAASRGFKAYFRTPSGSQRHRRSRRVDVWSSSLGTYDNFHINHSTIKNTKQKWACPHGQAPSTWGLSVFSPSWSPPLLRFPIPPCSLVFRPREFSSNITVSPSDLHLFWLYYIPIPHFLMEMLHWVKMLQLLEHFWHRLLEGASLDETGQVASLSGAGKRLHIW